MYWFTACFKKENNSKHINPSDSENSAFPKRNLQVEIGDGGFQEDIRLILF